MALIQLVVMIVLAGPGYCLELSESAGTDESCISIVVGDQDRDSGKDECPCCPADESGADACAACGNCAFYAPLASIPHTCYRPSVARLQAFDSFTKLTDVDIPIFVPPQNLV